MLSLKLFLPAALLFSTLGSTAYATEIDLIYNVSGPDASDSRAAWHGARVAKHILDENGKHIDLVLYNGQSVEKLNAAIGQMRAQSESTSIVIGLGSTQEMTAAAKPLLSANKIFITTTEIDIADGQQLGNHFFSAIPTNSIESDLAATHFETIYEDRFHSKPTTAAYKGYNAVMLAAAALEKANDQSIDALAKSIQNLTNNSQKSQYPLVLSSRAESKSFN
jgi:ABC-type branched-subunit amino acid transport system substrate-binding protein